MRYAPVHVHDVSSRKDGAEGTAWLSAARHACTHCRTASTQLSPAVNAVPSWHFVSKVQSAVVRRLNR